MGRYSIFEFTYIVWILFLAFFIFTFMGAGNILIVSVVGALLCMMGILQPAEKADLWILVPLIIYNLISVLSGIRTYGDTINSFASTQAVFPVIYLLMAYLGAKERSSLKFLCSVWIGLMGAIGMAEFSLGGFRGSTGRMAGIMGNPNAMGIMLALGWFGLKSFSMDLKKETLSEETIPICKLIKMLQALMLMALALTLSVGSIGAFGIGFLAMYVYSKGKRDEFIAGLDEAIAAFGCGVLLYTARDYTDIRWLSSLICIYAFTLAYYWDQVSDFIRASRNVQALISAAGICGIIGIILLRPNAGATFSERLAMIKNGLGYMGLDPVLGIGPYMWRRLNLQYDEMYFNTWHIHNIFIHVGAELGLIAMAMLIVTLVRHLVKHEDGAQRGAFFAALVHNLMDTSFFYMATVPYLMMMSSEDERRTVRLNANAVRAVFVTAGLWFLINLIQCII